MAAYAALVTLINLLEDMQNHPRLSTSLDRKQIQSLNENVHFLLDFVESNNSNRGRKLEEEELERKITYAAHEAEDVIESHIVDRVRAGSAGSNFLVNAQKKIRYVQRKIQKKIKSEDDYSRLKKVIKHMDFIKEKIVEIEKEHAGIKDESVLAYSSRPSSSSTRKTRMLGFEEELVSLLDILTGQGHRSSKKEMIAITGMCGMGKTTLARNVFENPLIVHHFHIRAWATISHEYRAIDIIYQLLSSEGKSKVTGADLKELLYRELFGRRYLIILDDVWGDDVWDELRACFPENGNGSRIVMTTRHKTCCSFCLYMKFLDRKNSWKLLCENVFGEDDCPSKLVEIGLYIVEQCHGLPLSLVVIGGHLSKSARTREYWEYIANNINSFFTSGHDHRSAKVLSLSYNHLPACLKPCFLYTGIFREDEEIFSAKLIKLWVSEGFIRPNQDQCLEEIAVSYLKDLVDRNLILVHKRDRNGEIMSCKIHDLIRDLCLRIAEKEKFLCVMKLQDSPRPLTWERRVVIHGGRGPIQALESAPGVRSLICNAQQLPKFNFKLLKVQDSVNSFQAHSLQKLFREQVNLRCLYDGLHPGDDSSCHSSGSYSLPDLKLPSSISRLWNLQTLILGGNFEGDILAPPEIWKMSRLRHLVCNRIHLPDPPSSKQNKHIVLQNLQTLSEVVEFRMSEDVCKRIPNIKKLQVFYSSPGIVTEFKSLTKMESLTLEFHQEPISRDSTQSLEFPSSLQELCLIKCCVSWENLSVIGSLPSLNALKLGFSVQGEEWNPVEGEFLSLKHLEIWNCDDLIYWNADRCHFPVLERLTLRQFSNLIEIPSGIGEIPTLVHIQLEECSVSAAVSAMRILVEQESFGNEVLQLDVLLRREEDYQSFREMMQEEDLNSTNLRLITTS